jgi:hypothetical protein
MESRERSKYTMRGTNSALDLIRFKWGPTHAIQTRKARVAEMQIAMSTNSMSAQVMPLRFRVYENVLGLIPIFIFYEAFICVN